MERLHRTIISEDRFKLGEIIILDGAYRLLQEAQKSADEFIERHVKGDWGNVDDADRVLNDKTLEFNFDRRIHSEYYLPTDERIWIFTQWNRALTSIVAPFEYSGHL